MNVGLLLPYATALPCRTAWIAELTKDAADEGLVR